MHTTLQANILAKLAEILPDHIQLPYGIQIDQNKLGKTAKGYAVLLGGSTVSGSPIAGQLTLNTSIQVRLSDNSPQEKHTDQAQQTTSNELADRCLTVFKALAAAKLNSVGVRNVTLLDIAEPTFIDGEKTIYRTLTIEANLRA